MCSPLNKTATIQYQYLISAENRGKSVRKYVTHLGYAIPFTHTGLKASYTFNSKVGAMFEVVNGWDLLRDNNHSKSLGAQLTLSPAAPISVVLNWIGGPELANDNNRKRNVFDIVAVLKATSWLTLGVDGDYGHRGSH